MSRHTTACGINIVFKAQRVFRLSYQCEACPNQWQDETLVVTHGYCPSCDARIEEPYHVEEIEIERPEFDLSDEEIA